MDSSPNNFQTGATEWIEGVGCAPSLNPSLEQPLTTFPSVKAKKASQAITYGRIQGFIILMKNLKILQ